jgi:hypothetical protein
MFTMFKTATTQTLLKNKEGREGRREVEGRDLPPNGHYLSADEGNRLMQQWMDEGMKESEAFAAMMERMKGDG